MKTYAIVGVGSIGRAVMRELLDGERDARIVALDVERASLEAAAAAGGGRVETRLAPDASPAALARQLAGAGAVVNCTVGAQCVEILAAAIAARVPYVDVHGILFNERLALDAQAREAGVTALLGMGVSPGLTNLLAGHGARQAAGRVTVDCEYVTFRPLNATAGLLETALRQFRDGVRAPVYENGRIDWHPPFSGAMKTRFHGLDEDVEIVCTPHSEPVTIPHFLPGLHRVTVRGSYHPSIMALLKSLHAFGLLDPALRVPAGGERVDFQPVLREALMGDGTLRPSGVAPRYIMRVRVTGEEGGRRTGSLVTLGHDPGWDALPQGRMTALPAAWAARQLARGEIARPGICSPELLEDRHVDDCLALLRERGLWIHREAVA